MSLYKDASLVMIPSAYKDGKLYSIRPTDGSGDFDFSRGSNLAATRVDVNGLIEKGRENLLLNSNQFNATWDAFNGASVTGGQTGYDGSSDSWLLDRSNFNAHVNQTLSFSSVGTFSVYAKAGTLNWMRLRDNNGVGAYFDLSGSGAVGLTSGLIDSAIESIGGGWFRCSVIANWSSGSFKIYQADANGDTSGTSGSIYIQDAQLEQGLVATDYIETTTTSVSAGILEDMPRLDYSGSCPSLLLEPQRTNLLSHSEYIDSYYTFNNASATDNATTSPEGVQNATKLVEDSTNSPHNFQRQLPVANGNYAFSVYAKAGERDFLIINAYGNASYRTWFNLSTGQVGTSATGNNPVMEDVGNGWYRCSISRSLSGTKLFQIAVSSNDFFNNYQGDGTSGIYIYGAQVESGSYPTSYIPTYGTSQTRSDDNSSLGSLQSNSIINGSTATLLFEGLKNGEPIFSNFVITANNNTNKSLLIDNSAGGIRLRVFNASSGQDATLTTSAVSDGAFKYLIRWDNGELKVFLNGSSVGTATISAYEYLSAILKEGSWSNNTIKQFLIFPTALTDSECIALTTL